MAYGLKNEILAKTRYLALNQSSHLHRWGFLVNNEFCFLGATPDARVCCEKGEGIVEIKCPFTARNMILTYACTEIRGFCLKKDCDGNLKLDRGHEYYAQVQGQLMISGAAFCEFIVYTQADMHTENILPDIPFMLDMLRRLSDFFQKFAKPFLDGEISN